MDARRKAARRILQEKIEETSQENGYWFQPSINDRFALRQHKTIKKTRKCNLSLRGQADSARACDISGCISMSAIYGSWTAYLYYLIHFQSISLPRLHRFIVGKRDSSPFLSFADWSCFCFQSFRQIFWECRLTRPQIDHFE